MYSFTPTDEQQMLVDSVRRYATDQARRAAHEADETGTMAPDVIRKGWNLGILPGLIPDTFGGYAEGPAAVTGALALEELASGDLSTALELWAPALFALPILFSGTEAQKQEYLPAFCDAARPLMSAALIEPRVLFDPRRPATVATRSGSGFVLNGEKAYVPLAAEAERLIIYARDSETGAVNGFIVDRGAEGLVVGERERLMGVKAVPLYRLGLSNVPVSPDRVVGGEGGTAYDTILNRSAIALGAMAVGVARAAFEYATNYAKERVQFGSPIGTRQAVAFRLAEVATEIDAARLMVWEAAWLADQGKDFAREAALLKHYTARAVMFATDSGVQVLGGHGYIREHPVERWLRNARGFTTFDGLALV